MGEKQLQALANELFKKKVCFPQPRLCRMAAAMRSACPFLSGLIQATGSQRLKRFPA